MNAIPDPVSMALRTVDWTETFREVNEWRGACLHHLTVVEMAVTETLMELQKVAPSGQNVRLAQLGGQRLEALLTAISSEGPFSSIGEKSHKVLADYRARHEAFRHLLCHGQFKVVIEPNGHWLVIVHEITVKSGVAQRSANVIEQDDAHSRLEQLNRDGKMIRSILGQLRKAATTSA